MKIIAHLFWQLNFIGVERYKRSGTKTPESKSKILKVLELSWNARP
jgi:hypothetical protein